MVDGILGEERKTADAGVLDELVVETDETLASPAESVRLVALMFVHCLFVCVRFWRLPLRDQCIVFFNK